MSYTHSLAALNGLRGIFLRERKIERECDTKAEVEILEVQGFTQEGSREIQNAYFNNVIHRKCIYELKQKKTINCLKTLPKTCLVEIV